MQKLSRNVTFPSNNRAYMDFARTEYGSEAYKDGTDVVIGSTTVARFYQAEDGALVLVDKNNFAEVEKYATGG